MCLAVPVKIVKIIDNKAIGEIEGVKKELDISLISPVKIGDYVLLHAGFAINIIDKKEAKGIIKIWKKLLEEA